MLKYYLLFPLFFLGKTLHAQPCREVIGYFPSWKWYDRKQLVNPITINYQDYTIINYAFFQPNPDGSISPFDPLADKSLLLGVIGPDAPPGYARRNDFGDAQWHLPGTSLVYKAHEQGVKVLISIGGWTMSNHFSPIAASPEKRRRFAHACADIIRAYGVDGIDLDWEYPGYLAQNGSAADRENFTLLLDEVRRALDSAQLDGDRPLLLTAAFGVAFTRMQEIEWEKVAPMLSFVNLMTYDYYGRDFAETNHNSPLFRPAKGIEGYDSHSTVQYLIKRYGVPSSKICLGVPFYGRSMKTKGRPGLHVASSRATDNATFPEDEGTPAYYHIMERQHRFVYQWDSLAQAPFLQGKDLNTFVSFDDERSVAQKARYIRDFELAGALVWDITGDCIENRYAKGVIESTPLADALKAALCGDPALEPATRPELDHLALLPPRLHLIYRYTFAPRASVSLPGVEKPRKKKDKRKQKRTKTPSAYFDVPR